MGYDANQTNTAHLGGRWWMNGWMDEIVMMTAMTIN